MLAVVALLFVVGSAIVAFGGWPRIASQAAPSALQLSPAPASPSRVSRRLRAVAAALTVPVANRAAVRGARAGVPTVRLVGLSTPDVSASTNVTPKPIGIGGDSARSGPGSLAVGPPVDRPVTLAVPTTALTRHVRTVVTQVASTAANASSKFRSLDGG